jgi:hypothetical protein
MSKERVLTMKQGRPPTSWPFLCRADFEDAVIEHRARGWNVSRIARKFAVNWRTIKAVR